MASQSGQLDARFRTDSAINYYLYIMAGEFIKIVNLNHPQLIKERRDAIEVLENEAPRSRGFWEMKVHALLAPFQRNQKAASYVEFLVLYINEYKLGIQTLTT